MPLAHKETIASRVASRAIPARWAPYDDASDERWHEQRKTRGMNLGEWVHLGRGGIAPERAAATLGVTLGAVEKAASRSQHADALRPFGWSQAA